LLVLCAIVAVCHAQVMPSMPSAYQTGFVSTSTSTPPQSVNGILYLGSVNQTRTDVSSSMYSSSTYYLVVGNTAYTYSVFSYGGAPPQCYSQSFPYVPPSAPGTGCVGPTYAGTAVINGITCQHWTVTCSVSTPNNHTITTDLYWNGNTPVEITTKDSDSAVTTTMLYSNFQAGAPDPSVFKIPAQCNSTRHDAERVAAPSSPFPARRFSPGFFRARIEHARATKALFDLTDQLRRWVA